MNLPGAGFFLFHAGASVALAGVAWLLGMALQRGLRISPAARGYWLGIWAVAVMPTLLAIALHGLGAGQLALTTAQPLPLPLLDEFSTWAGTAGSVPEPTAGIAQGIGPGLLLALMYALGAAIAARRWIRGLRAIRRIIEASTSADSASLPGPLSRQQWQRLQQAGIALRWSDSRVSPFVVCHPQPAIVLPAALAQRLDDRQLQLVLRHEAHHLAQRDPQRAALMRSVEIVFWFNPFLRRIAERVQMAAELCCDAAALADAQASRRAYAQAYLETVRLAATTLPRAAAAFTPGDPGNHKLRITHMLHGDSTSYSSPRSRRLLVILLLGAGLAAAAAQVTVASSLGLHSASAATLPTAPAQVTANASAEATATAEASVQTTPAFASPLAVRKITSHYGANTKPYTQPHRGLDFGGKRGTPVLAPAAGVVVEATTLYRNTPKYGTVVVLDHGGGWQSLYAHLEGFDVKPGERISAGTQIGRIGTTGVTTGPHVHVEVLRDGQRVDPEPLLK